MTISDYDIDINQEYTISSQALLIAVDPDFERDGYVISAWTENTDGTGRQYTLEETIAASEVSSDLTFWAQWKKLDGIQFYTTNGNVVSYSISDLSNDNVPANVLAYTYNNNNTLYSNEPYMQNKYLSCKCNIYDNHGNITKIIDTNGDVLSVGEFSLFRLTSLTDIELPYAYYLEYGSLLGCYNLTNITMPNLTYIQPIVDALGNILHVNPFSMAGDLNKPQLTSFSIAEDNDTFYLIDENGNIGKSGCMLVDSNLKMLYWCSYKKANSGDIIIPDGISCIADDCFPSNSITYNSIVDLNEVQKLEATTIQQNGPIKLIANNLTSVYEFEAFGYFNNCSSFVIPKLQNLGSAIFINCYNIKEIVLSGITTPAECDSPFYGTEVKNVSVYVSNDYMVEQFQNTSPWSELCADGIVTFIPVL